MNLLSTKLIQYFAGSKTLRINLNTKATRPNCQKGNLGRIRFNSEMGSQNKSALVLIATGTEEIEAVSVIDTMRRAGITVTVATLGSDLTPVVCSREVMLRPEKTFSQAVQDAPYDAIVLPGGLKGAEAFKQSEHVGHMLKDQENSGRLVAAICAAPTALRAHGIGLNKAITSYPGVKDIMTEGNCYKYKEDRVVVDGGLITSRGPGTALEWSVAIVEYLCGKEVSSDIGSKMLLKP